MTRDPTQVPRLGPTQHEDMGLSMSIEYQFQSQHSNIEYRDGS